MAATPNNDSRRTWTKADRRLPDAQRQIIEGIIGQLEDFFCLERHRAKTLRGLLTRLAAKVVAYTCAQRMNDSLGRPLCATWRTCLCSSLHISRLSEPFKTVMRGG